MHAKVYDRTRRPVVYRSLAKTSDEWLSWIHSILLQLDRLQLTAVYCNPRGGVKTTPRKNPFSQCEQLQGITRNSHTGEKWIRGNTDDDWINDRKQNNKHNNMFNVDRNLKHVNTHEYNTWSLVSALFLFVLSCLFSVVLVVAQDFARVCASFIMSHAHVDWLSLSLRPLHLLHFLSHHHV